jgi:hypothetical protein
MAGIAAGGEVHAAPAANAGRRRKDLVLIHLH